eukprot:ANDGO_05815.mRNA.1 hypothetical protein
MSEAMIIDEEATTSMASLPRSLDDLRVFIQKIHVLNADIYALKKQQHQQQRQHEDTSSSSSLWAEQLKSLELDSVVLHAELRTVFQTIWVSFGPSFFSMQNHEEKSLRIDAEIRRRKSLDSNRYALQCKLHELQTMALKLASKTSDTDIVSLSELQKMGVLIDGLSAEAVFSRQAEAEFELRKATMSKLEDLRLRIRLVQDDSAKMSSVLDGMSAYFQRIHAAALPLHTALFSIPSFQQSVYSSQMTLVQSLPRPLYTLYFDAWNTAEQQKRDKGAADFLLSVQGELDAAIRFNQTSGNGNGNGTRNGLQQQQQQEQHPLSLAIQFKNAVVTVSLFVQSGKVGIKVGSVGTASNVPLHVFDELFFSGDHGLVVGDAVVYEWVQKIAKVNLEEPVSPENFRPQMMVQGRTDMTFSNFIRVAQLRFASFASFSRMVDDLAARRLPNRDRWEYPRDGVVSAFEFRGSHGQQSSHSYKPSFAPPEIAKLTLKVRDCSVDLQLSLYASYPFTQPLITALETHVANAGLTLSSLRSINVSELCKHNTENLNRVLRALDAVISSSDADGLEKRLDVILDYLRSLCEFIQNPVARSAVTSLSSSSALANRVVITLPPAASLPGPY